jgi:hypothetical protein
LVLKSCKGTQCIDPWRSLHPGGDVRTLENALETKFDEFYEQKQVKIKFDRCELGTF